MPTPDSPSTTGKRIRLRDGRSLGYAEYGDPAGKPVVFFQGTPSSRLFHHPDESIAVSLGARIITMDRPGFGLSDFQLGRTLLDWPDDVVELAGEEDASTPLPMAQHMASAIPNCRATFLPGEGHFLLFNHWKEILAVLVS